MAMNRRDHDQRAEHRHYDGSLTTQGTVSTLLRSAKVKGKGNYLGCVYTYPDIRISGYPDVRDPDIFGAFTRVGSKRFRRLHVSRYPDALYAAYSLCVGEIRKCFFLVKLHAFKLSSIFFLSFCWCLLAGRQGQNFVWWVQLSTIKDSVKWHGSAGNWSSQCM